MRKFREADSRSVMRVSAGASGKFRFGSDFVLRMESSSISMDSVASIVLRKKYTKKVDQLCRRLQCCIWRFFCLRIIFQIFYGFFQVY